MRIVISQSMLFPWVGLLEQVRLADAFVHYDDVQFSKGSFTNRVQIKTAQGMRWMTVPLENLRLGQTIDEVKFAPIQQWRGKHLDLLNSSFATAPFKAEALGLVEEVYAQDYPHVGALARASFRALYHYFGLAAGKQFYDVTELDIPGSSSDRVLATLLRLKGTVYITGHGASKYLDHEAFDRAGVRVEYMDYRRLSYPQSHGDFTPYVSGLDLVAHCGRDGARYICSETVFWRAFNHESA